MGGSVAWTIRCSDGTQHRMCRWTNLVGDLVWLDGFQDEDPDAIEVVLRGWRKMAADYEANHASGEFESAITPWCAPYPYGLRPAEYGIIVTDFQTKTMISCQDYSPLNKCSAWGKDVPETLRDIIDRIEAGADCNESIPDRRDASISNSKRELLFVALRERQVLEIQMVGKSADAKTIETKGWSATEVQEAIASGRDEGYDFWNITFDMPGWSVIEFPNHTKEGRRHVFDEILRLGFELDASERADFESWVEGDADEE